MTEIKAIECPKCGDTHKAVLRPGDFRCASCGTEYFIDDGTVKFGQRPTAVGVSRAPLSSGQQTFWIVCFLVFFVGSTALIAYVGSQQPTRRLSTNASRGYAWYSEYANALYLSPDKKPVLLTLGTKVGFGKNDARADYVAFIDMSDNSTIKTLPLPDAASVTDHAGGTNFDVRQFVNGEIYIIAEKSQLFRVRPSDYDVVDVTQSLFKGLPQLDIGIAKIEFTWSSDEQGFKIIANDGKSYVYRARTHDISTSGTGMRATDAAQWLADTEERDAFSFSMRYDSDFPELPGQLIAFRYRTYRSWPRVPAFDFHSRGLSYEHWDDPKVLANEGALTHRDFTPGRVYFDYGVLYFDSDYVLISYRPTPAKNAVRYVQLLDAKTAAIIFTTRLDVYWAPTECVRYKDGFAIVSLPDAFTLSFSGALAKHTPFMFEK